MSGSGNGWTSLCLIQYVIPAPDSAIAPDPVQDGRVCKAGEQDFETVGKGLKTEQGADTARTRCTTTPHDLVGRYSRPWPTSGIPVSLYHTSLRSCPPSDGDNSA